MTQRRERPGRKAREDIAEVLRKSDQSRGQGGSEEDPRRERSLVHDTGGQESIPQRCESKLDLAMVQRSRNFGEGHLSVRMEEFVGEGGCGRIKSGKNLEMIVSPASPTSPDAHSRERDPAHGRSRKTLSSFRAAGKHGNGQARIGHRVGGQRRNVGSRHILFRFRMIWGAHSFKIPFTSSQSCLLALSVCSDSVLCVVFLQQHRRLAVRLTAWSYCDIDTLYKECV